MSVAIVIPARFKSQRYPGKPLAELRGASGVSRTLIERSWRAACEVAGVDRVVVATDDDRIRSASEAFGAEVLMTSESCQNGTERCAEVVQMLGDGFEYVVNLQGDAPLTPPWFVEELLSAIKADATADIATPVLRCNGKMRAELIRDRHEDRVGGTTAVFSDAGAGLYFSKEVIPFSAATYAPEDMTPVYHHVGVYAYRRNALLEYPNWPVGRLEALEGLEQLRFLENARRVLCVEVEAKGRQFWELNNPSDIEVIERMMAEMDLE